MIETPRLRLRAWRESDREPFRRMNGDPRVMEFFPKLLSPVESDELADRIDAALERRGFGLFAAEVRESGAFAGFIGLSVPSFEAHFTPCVEIGWRLDVPYWNQGLATEGARAVLRYGFEMVGLREIVSFTATVNLRSIRVMEKLGMRHDRADDFDHPSLPEGHPLRRHVLYRVARLRGLKQDRPGGMSTGVCTFPGARQSCRGVPSGAPSGGVAVSPYSSRSTTENPQASPPAPPSLGSIRCTLGCGRIRRPLAKHAA